MKKRLYKNNPAKLFDLLKSKVYMFPIAPALLWLLFRCHPILMMISEITSSPKWETHSDTEKTSACCPKWRKSQGFATDSQQTALQHPKVNNLSGHIVYVRIRHKHTVGDTDRRWFTKLSDMCWYLIGCSAWRFTDLTNSELFNPVDAKPNAFFLLLLQNKVLQSVLKLFVFGIFPLLSVIAFAKQVRESIWIGLSR